MNGKKAIGWSDGIGKDNNACIVERCMGHGISYGERGRD